MSKDVEAAAAQLQPPSLPPPPAYADAIKTPMVMIPITVVSDFNCPWCYVAHRELQTALARIRLETDHLRTAQFCLEYRPFELDPTLPKAQEKPMCKVACYLAKFGGEQKMNQVCDLLKQRGKEVGINFHFRGKTRQTTNAHRLSLKAFLIGGEKMQVKMMDALFAAFFEQETDIGCYDFLSKAAESTGIMTYQETKEFLASEKLTQEVQMLLRHSVLRGINSVPCTIIGNHWVINGAEKADVFYRGLRTAYAVMTANASAGGTHATTMSNMLVSQTGPSCQPKTNPNAATAPPVLAPPSTTAPTSPVEKTAITV